MTDAANPDIPTRDVLLDIRDLQKIYKTKKGNVLAVENLSVNLNKGEFVSIIGPSGAGKTTLLKCISGLLPVTSGTLTLNGKAYNRPPAGMAIVFQEYSRSLFPWLSVERNVELPLKDQGVPRAERRARTNAALEQVGLVAFGHSYPWQLSGGMQQRVAIARAIAFNPSILLMDEPYAAVDAQTRADLEDLVRELRDQLGLSVLFVTHDIDESVYLSDRVVVLSGAPSVVLDNVVIDLPRERDQVSTRAMPRFLELRAHLHKQVQRAKQGHRNERKTEDVVTEGIQESHSPH